MAGYEFYGQAELPQQAKHNAASQVRKRWSLSPPLFFLDSYWLKFRILYSHWSEYRFSNPIGPEKLKILYSHWPEYRFSNPIGQNLSSCLLPIGQNNFSNPIGQNLSSCLPIGQNHFSNPIGQNLSSFLPIGQNIASKILLVQKNKILSSHWPGHPDCQKPA